MPPYSFNVYGSAEIEADYPEPALNAMKFVEQGFIRFRTKVKHSKVVLLVKDSGQGVSVNKQNGLFACFQESSDLLNQGTGVGLSICLNLVRLMGGKIWLDPSYDSGIPGCPGARFVVDLYRPQIESVGSSDNCEKLTEEKERATATIVSLTGKPSLDRTREPDRVLALATNSSVPPEPVEEALPKNLEVLCR